MTRRLQSSAPENPPLLPMCFPIWFSGKQQIVEFAEVIEKIGAATVTRTPDPLITNEVLYQLSYCGCIWQSFANY
jgi:hypothetical protein